MTTHDDRVVIKHLDGRARMALEVIKEHEVEGITSVPELCRALAENPVSFLTFSCLGTYKGKEELKLDLFETFFLRRFFKEAQRLLEALRIKGVGSHLLVVLPDKEPKRTWGWQTAQEEITGLCRLMIEEKAAMLPSSWEVALWSDLESAARVQSYEETLAWAEKAAHPLWVKEEAEHMQGFPEIFTRHGARQVAIRQIAAYALEGLVLEELFPRAILLQSEFPASRKDRMYNPLRKGKLPVVHPFKLY